MVTKYFKNGKSKVIIKIGDGKIQDFIRSTKTNCPTGNSGSTTIPPIGDAIHVYCKTCGNNNELNNNNIFVNFERTDDHSYIYNYVLLW